MLKSLRTYATAAAVLATATASLSGIAHADHGGNANSGMPDNASQGVTNSGVLTNYGIDAMYQGARQLDRSNIKIKMGDASDIIVYDYKYGDTGWYGQTKCRSGGGQARKCDKFEVRFNESSMSNSTSKWKSLGCHEFGHTGGLGHRKPSNDSNKNSCMLVDSWPTKLDNHDISQINKFT